MPYLLLGLAALVLFLVLGRAFAKTNPTVLAKGIRKIGGILALIGALAFSLTGKFALAFPLAILGLGMLKKGVFAGIPFPGSTQKSPGQTSRVRTEFLVMTLDHDTGAMDGRILKGDRRNEELSALSLSELLPLWQAWESQDAQSARLVEAYLDYAHAGWREKAGYSSGGGGGEASSSAGGGRMTVDEAYDILGLTPGVSAADIRKSHRLLMKKLHPDQGGSTYLAAKINQAKDMLLEIMG